MSGSDYSVSEGSGMMEAQHHARVSVFQVAVDCDKLSHLDPKHTGPLVDEPEVIIERVTFI